MGPDLSVRPVIRPARLSKIAATDLPMRQSVSAAHDMPALRHDALSPDDREDAPPARRGTGRELVVATDQSPPAQRDAASEDAASEDLADEAASRRRAYLRAQALSRRRLRGAITDRKV